MADTTNQTFENRKADNETVQFLKNFLSEDRNKRLITLLRGVLSEFGLGLARSSVFFLRVKAVNANSYTNVKNAYVHTELHRNESRPVVSPLCLFFLRGYATLEDFLDQQDPKMPENLSERQALRDLLQFLSNTKELSILTDSKADKCKTEAGVTLSVRLAQHLMAPLVPNNSFLIDLHSGLQFAMCCPVQHPMSGVLGDTSFGCPNGWHGHADVLLHDSQIPLTALDSAEEDAISVTSESFVSNKSENFTTESLSQLTAQTLVHSFVQHRKKPMSPCSLVPGIGICSEKMIVYLYDCVDDILLTTGPVDLYAQMGLFGLNARAVLILWLILNHNIFSNKTPERYKSYSAAFHHVLGPVQLERYINTSEQPFRTRLEEQNILQILNEEHVSFEDDLTEEKNILLSERKTISLN